ncbi:hypothetical protein [Thermococcus sp. Bubb.Bath]|nr:hypothetical protein [Thermococcus sp. Bubb.Bath]
MIPMERGLSFVVVFLLPGALFSVLSFLGASAAPNYTYSAS